MDLRYRVYDGCLCKIQVVQYTVYCECLYECIFDKFCDMMREISAIQLSVDSVVTSNH